MIRPEFREEILQELNSLPPDQQRRVLEFARELALSRRRGTRGRALLRFSGSVTAEETARMSEAIEAACERVDPHEW